MGMIAMRPSDATPEQIERWHELRRRQVERSRRTSALLAAAGECESGEEGAPARRWYAVRVMPHREKAVHNRLDAAGVMAWLPLRKMKVVRYRGRKRPSEEGPVIHGLVFVRVSSDAHVWAGLIRVRDVLGVLGGLERPLPISDREMRQFNDLAKGGAFDFGKVVADRKAFEVGHGVVCRAGPFEGMEGVVVELGTGSHKEDARVDLVAGSRRVAIWMPLALLKNCDLKSATGRPADPACSD